MLNGIKKIIKMAWQSFWRNIWLSLVTIFIILMAFISISTLVTLNVFADVAVETIKEKVDLSIYFNSDVKSEEVLKIKSELSNLSEVENVEYISRDQALIDLREKQKGNPLILKSIEELGENPLGDSLIIKARDIDNYKEIITYISSTEYASKLWNQEFDEDYHQIIDKLESISSRIGKIGMFITFIFVIIAFLIIFNTIRIGIYTHREEIGIMKLVGARSRFVRAPFLLEAIFFITIAWLINLMIFFPLATATHDQIGSFIGNTEFSLFQYYQANFWAVFGWQLALVIALGLISCAIAMRKYLRV